MKLYTTYAQFITESMEAKAAAKAMANEHYERLEPVYTLLKKSLEDTGLDETVTIHYGAPRFSGWKGEDVVSDPSVSLGLQFDDEEDTVAEIRITCADRYFLVREEVYNRSMSVDHKPSTSQSNDLHEIEAYILDFFSRVKLENSKPVSVANRMKNAPQSAYPEVGDSDLKF
jgi:hypothetical protein